MEEMLYQKIDETMKKYGFKQMSETEDNRPEYTKDIEIITDLMIITLTMQFYYCKHYSGTDIEIVATQDECGEQNRYLEMHYSDLHSNIETIIDGVLLAIGFPKTMLQERQK